MVESASKVLDAIPEDRSAGQRDFAFDSNPEYDISGLRVFLGNDGVWAGFLKDCQPGIEVVDVLFGPFDLDMHMVDRLQQEVESIPILAPLPRAGHPVEG
jgi:hypothetical protein